MRSVALAVALLALVVALGPGVVAQDATAPVEGNVVLIGWDGAQRDHVNELIAAGKLPNLVALSDEGTRVDIDVTRGATDTKTGWTQILTGHAPDVTGVWSNARYQPIPEGLSVFEQLERTLGPDNIATLAVIGKKGHVDADPPKLVPWDQFLTQWQRQQAQRAKKAAAQGKPAPPERKPPEPKVGARVADGTVVEEGGQLFVESPGKPWLNASQKMDLWVNGLTRNDAVGQRALDTLVQYRDHRFFLFVHFAEPDHVGHASGENSEQYSEGIISDDEWTGRIIAKLRELGIYDRTRVYVTADHGFDEGQTTHKDAPHIFLATNDKDVNRSGDRCDVGATILKRFGVDVKTLQPALYGVPLDEAAPPRERIKPEPRKQAKPAAARRAGKRARGAAPVL